MRRWLIASLVVIVVGTAAAQYRGTTSVNAVVVPVTVRTTSGRLVSRVAPERFHLFVDGLEVPVPAIDREEDLPLSLGFILDTSGSMGGQKILACRRLIRTFLEQREPSDELALWTFGDDRVLERFPFGTGWYLLPRILETVRAWGTTALYDMLQRVPEVVSRAHHPRRAVILLTDGVDTASAIDHDGATDIVHRLRTPIYVVGVEPPPQRVDPKGPTYEAILRRIAEGSGGGYRRIPSADDMPDAVDELLEELSSRFILTFETSGVGQRRWRTIEVTVDGYTATTRKGYSGTLP